MIIQMQSGWFTHFTVGVSTLNSFRCYLVGLHILQLGFPHLMIIQMQSGWFTHFTVGVSTLNDHSDAIWLVSTHFTIWLVYTFLGFPHLMIIQMQSGWFTHFTVGVSTLNDHSDAIWLVYTFYSWGFHT